MPDLSGDRDAFLQWQHLLGQSDGRLATPDLDGLNVADARDAWQNAVFGEVLPASTSAAASPPCAEKGLNR